MFIQDKFGYIIDEAQSFGTALAGDFMAGHDFVIGKNGGTYYFCNEYSVAEIVNPDTHNCGVAMDYGMQCQCGSH